VSLSAQGFLDSAGVARRVVESKNKEVIFSQAIRAENHTDEVNAMLERSLRLLRDLVRDLLQCTAEHAWIRDNPKSKASVDRDCPK
jgi:hypothetical protein